MIKDGTGSLQPSRIVILAFLLTMLAGTVLLCLPVARTGAGENLILDQSPALPAAANSGIAPHEPPTKTVPSLGPALPGGAPLSVALFTAASATCVTGLIVVDTGTYWSPFGQTVLLGLMELGGIGTMTVVSLVSLALGRATSDTREVAAHSLRGIPLGGIKHTVAAILGFSLVAQMIFGVILAWRLGASGKVPGGAMGVFHGFFLAASAFNNAGFAPWTDSVTGFNHDPVVLGSLAVLILVGGLGFPVWAVLWVKGPHWWRLNLNVRIMLVGTAVLVAGGTVLMAVLEWNNPATLGAHHPGEKLLNAFFAAVSPRTAGFNAIDIGAQYPATWLVTDGLMLVGGGSAGTAGGLKVTTTAVVLATLWGEVRGSGAINILGLRLARAAQRQALAVFSLFIGLVGISVFLMVLTTPWGLSRSLFEVCSALATVGLSTGITPSLPVANQALLIALMLVGRLGPLTIATAWGARKRRLVYELPKDYPLIG
ncbi:cation transport protein [Mobiluncus mulieris FB024-16]|uniref:TrkH family potassium uptake protein n=1 Tax=Mobiluncus mulieris TaxID=2052 RepID=UPI0001E5180C|nr:potassium transporter TrkG [Mobiluncus mulieris]EFN92334.1 cation transport protein [Mobiluncus mulieris FB024-16]